MEQFFLVFFAGILAGAMNSMAGGGSFVTLPVLVFSGMPSVVANASSTVALFPGAISGALAYREECRSFTGAPIKAMIMVSLAGGWVGALLLYMTPSTAFDRMLPWLLVVGTVAFAFGPYMGALIRRVVRLETLSLLAGQCLLAVYGGYFGGAVGIMMMAVWSVLGFSDIKSMNAAKTLLVGMTNLTAVGFFVITGLVSWPQTSVMLIGAVLGGYAGARFALLIPSNYLRGGIILFNVLITAAFFARISH